MGEKYFWGTILFFLVPFTVVTVIVMMKGLSVTKEGRLKTPIIEIVEKDILKQNIQRQQPKILRDLFRKEAELNATVDASVDRLFEGVYANVDKFLDYHYSVAGEYAELGHAATDNIDIIVKKKLFGKDFEERFHAELQKVAEKFAELLEAHSRLIGEVATADIDMRLNEQIFEAIKRDVAEKITLTAATFVGVVGGAKLATRIVPKITAKFLSKIGTKLAAKVAAKTAGKVAAAETGAAAGVLCGPFVWICSPALATAAWFTTDAVVIKADEMMTRETFRKEIVTAIDEEKNSIKNRLKRQLGMQFRNFSRQIQESYEAQHVKVKDVIYRKAC